MLGKRMGFASFIATLSKLAGRHRFKPPLTLPARLDCLLDSSAGQAPFLVDLPKLRSHFLLKHLEQLVDPACFNLAVRRHFIDHVW